MSDYIISPISNDRISNLLHESAGNNKNNNSDEGYEYVSRTRVIIIPFKDSQGLYHFQVKNGEVLTIDKMRIMCMGIYKDFLIKYWKSNLGKEKDGDDGKEVIRMLIGEIGKKNFTENCYFGSLMILYYLMKGEIKLNDENGKKFREYVERSLMRMIKRYPYIKNNNMNMNIREDLYSLRWISILCAYFPLKEVGIKFMDLVISYIKGFKRNFHKKSFKLSIIDILQLYVAFTAIINMMNDDKSLVRSIRKIGLKFSLFCIAEFCSVKLADKYDFITLGIDLLYTGFEIFERKIGFKKMKEVLNKRTSILGVMTYFARIEINSWGEVKNVDYYINLSIQKVNDLMSYLISNGLVIDFDKYRYELVDLIKVIIELDNPIHRLNLPVVLASSVLMVDKGLFKKMEDTKIIDIVYKKLLSFDKYTQNELNIVIMMIDLVESLSFEKQSNIVKKLSEDVESLLAKLKSRKTVTFVTMDTILHIFFVFSKLVVDNEERGKKILFDNNVFKIIEENYSNRYINLGIVHIMFVCYLRRGFMIKEEEEFGEFMTHSCNMLKMLKKEWFAPLTAKTNHEYTKLDKKGKKEYVDVCARQIIKMYMEQINQKTSQKGNVEKARLPFSICSCCKIRTHNLKRCSVCKQTYYCSVKCQRIDWKTHKKQCKK